MGEPLPATTIPIQWGEKVSVKRFMFCPLLRRMRKKATYGVYVHFQELEQGPHLPVSVRSIRPQGQGPPPPNLALKRSASHVLLLTLR